MKRTFIALVALIIAGTSIFLACNKDSENEEVKTNNTKKECVDNASGDIPILMVKRGKKVKIGEYYDCKGLKGTCWLWFGGLFAVQNVSQIFEFGTEQNCQSGYFGEQYLNEEAIALCSINTQEQCIDMLFDFSCSNDELKDAFFVEIEEGFMDFNEDIILDNEEMLASHQIESPIFIPMGTYPILNSFIDKNQCYIKVPFKKL